MKTAKGQGAKRHARAAAPLIVQEDLLRQAVKLSAENVRALAAIFRCWADQCERLADLKANKFPAEARN